jgi:hypothetical protein
MWPKLYSCALTIGFLFGTPVCFAQQSAGAKPESVPLPTGEVDPDAPNPFRDDLAPALQPAPSQPVPSASDFRPDFALITADTLDRLHSPILRQDLQIESAQSCATSNCHGGPRPGIAQPWARRGSEHQIWVENDPHAQSWRTMCSDESVAIMRRLNIMKEDQIVDQAGFDNCLACHNSSKRYDEPRRLRSLQVSVDRQSNNKMARHSAAVATQSIHHLISNRSGRAAQRMDANNFLREGVGCSSCHGPSEQWSNTHFQYHWSPLGATGEGFVEAGDLFVRARMCAACHVGDKDRDMNHDIIAAGHPTLRYELATFHAWQPKHWRDAEADDKTFYEAQLWLAGQVAATDASLSLLHARTADAHTISEWPEFAAFDCASCHHNLGLNNDRKPIDQNRKATARYSPWNEAGLRWLLNYRVENGQATDEDHQLIVALDAVRDAMEALPKPNPGRVGETVIEARRVLAAWLAGQAGSEERANFRSERLGQVVASAAGKGDTFRTWESAVQFYLAAVAARESWPGGWNGPLRSAADQLQNGLRYPEMIDVSRYEVDGKRHAPVLELSRVQAMQLGIELAGWLGPVQPAMIFDEAEDAEITEDLRTEMKQMIESINLRWKKIAEDRAAEVEKANAELKAKQEADEQENPQPKPKPREELLEELRKEQEQQAATNDET